MKTSARYYFLLLLSSLLSSCSQPRQLIPYESLLERLLDENQMARLDQPGAALASTYDRTGGNDDFSNFVRPGPDGWMVVADLEGPGFISRFWFTGSKDGKKRLRFYFDGEKNPSIETTMDEWMGKTEPLTLPFAGYEPYCWFSWLPVPYQKRLVIMEEAPVTGEKLYYHIAHHKLPPGQTVDNFKLPLSASSIALIDKIKQRWNDRSPAARHEETQSVTLAPQTRTRVLELAGPGLINELQFTPDWSGFSSPRDIEKALRELIVRMYWDGAANPSVEVPLGTLCGSMWSRMRYQSMHFGMKDETLMLRMPMPFGKSGVIEIENTGAQPVSLKVSAVRGNHEPGLGYFHSGWTKSTARDAGQPHTILQTAGRGVYAGCILGVHSFDQSWWVLEGDEQIHIDGETTPSWKGTGLEDYFNGGWYYANAIASPLHGMPYKVHFRNIQYRIHQADPVTFDKSLRMIFERGPDHASRANFESVSFYYLESPQAADSDLSRQSVHPDDDPLRKATAMFEINDRERLGDTTGARDFIQTYLEDFPDVPYTDALRKRLQNYTTRSPVPPGKALLGVYANMATTVFLDGRPVGKFGNPESMQFMMIDLEPGTHVLAVQTARQQYPDWVQVGLKYGDRIIGTDKTWKYSFNQAPGWNRSEFDDSTWPLHDYVWVKGPPEEPYIFCEPNEHVGMQSIPWGIRHPVDWPQGARQIFYRKKFFVE